LPPRFPRSGNNQTHRKPMRRLPNQGTPAHDAIAQQLLLAAAVSGDLVIERNPAFQTGRDEQVEISLVADRHILTPRQREL
jgi:hypothetical protein